MHVRPKLNRPTLNRPTRNPPTLNRPRLNRLLAIAALVIAPTVVLVAGPIAPQVVEAAPASAKYVPINPVRVMDTRVGLGGARLAAGATTSLTVVTADVAAAASVSPGAVVAVVLNVTAVDSAGVGYIAVWPAGQPQPATSALNATHTGHTLANLVTTPVGSGGAVQIFTQPGGDVVVDVQGVYTPSSSSVAGRFQSLTTSQRLFDTRSDLGRPLRPGEKQDIPGSPRAAAMVLNITTTGTTGPGYFTAWPAGRSMPTASNLNVERPGQTIANQVIAAEGSNNSVSIFSSGGGHLIVDLVGYISNGSAVGDQTDGLFVPLTPARLVDTRTPPGPTGGARPGVNGAVALQSAGLGGLPGDGGVGALALNVTLTDSAAPGFVTVYPSHTVLPTVSSLNADAAGQTASNHVITPVSNAGFSMYTSAGAHLIADVTGYWTGTATQETVLPAYAATPGGVVPQPASAPAAGPHAFIANIIPSPGYARWNPCQPIRYLVNDDRATPAQRQILDDVITAVRNGTGLDLQLVGRTSYGLNTSVPPNSVYANAVFAFSDKNASPGFISDAGAVGYGGPTWSGDTIVEGGAIFDASLGATDVMHEVILHEIGHAMGLAHVNDTTQVMNPSVSGPPFLTTFANGDRQGLWLLGAAQGCTKGG